MKILLISVSVIIFLMFLLPLFAGVHNFATAAGTLFGLCFLMSGIFIEKLSFTAQKYIVFVLFAAVVALLWFCGEIRRAGKTTADKQSVIIVLGCRVKGDIPSIALEKRTESAFFYLMKNPNAVAILSGGRGRDENISEAECMKNMLVFRGISADRLFLEECSASTAQNIRFSKKIIEENGFEKDVAIATSEYHIYRSLLIAKRYGLNAAAISSETSRLLLPTFLLRELAAIIKEKLLYPAPKKHRK